MSRLRRIPCYGAPGSAGGSAASPMSRLAFVASKRLLCRQRYLVAAALGCRRGEHLPGVDAAFAWRLVLWVTTDLASG